MQKFTDSCYRNVHMSSYQYCQVDYSQAQQQQYYDNYYNYMPYSYISPMGYQNNYPPQYLPTYDYPGDSMELNQLKRSLNLVQTTRKKDKDRYQWNDSLGLGIWAFDMTSHYLTTIELISLNNNYTNCSEEWYDPQLQ